MGACSNLKHDALVSSFGFSKVNGDLRMVQSNDVNMKWFAGCMVMLHMPWGIQGCCGATNLSSWTCHEEAHTILALDPNQHHQN